jgi:hypothetical protein
MYAEDVSFPKVTLSKRDNAKVSEGITALYVAGMGRIPVDGPIDAILREKARFTVGLGWNYRFSSNGKWMLIPIDKVIGIEFAELPKGIS